MLLADRVASMDLWLVAIGAAVYRGRIYVAGGEYQDPHMLATFRAVEAYDPASNTWSEMPPMPGSRHGLAVGVIGAGTVLFFRLHGNSASAMGKPAVTPLAVLGTTPAAKADNVAPSTVITVDLSTGLAPDSPMPSFTPNVPGSWSALSADELQFAGLALDGPRNAVDKIFKGATLHP